MKLTVEEVREQMRHFPICPLHDRRMRWRVKGGNKSMLCEACADWVLRPRFAGGIGNDPDLFKALYEDMVVSEGYGPSV